MLSDVSAQKSKLSKTMYDGIVEEIKDPYEDIRTISLKITSPGLTFKAGQWIDVYIPNLPVVGFSMTSPPHVVETQNILNLAVKCTEDPPAQWIHRECKLGDTLKVQVGGKFFYDPEIENLPHDILLIGGGIGINPLVSIAQHYVHLLKSGKYVTEGPPCQMSVLYSAKNQEALIFKELFRNLDRTVPTFSCRFFATSDTNASELPSDISGRRLARQDVESTMLHLSKDRLIAFVCGPSSMTDEVVDLLLSLGLSSDRIRFEKWW